MRLSYPCWGGEINCTVLTTSFLIQNVETLGALRPLRLGTSARSDETAGSQ